MGQRRAIWICAIILTAAAGLRVAGTFNDFWIDEIISWDIARNVTSPLQIFTSVHHDNNHHLNTLWMYLLGDRRNWIVYRILSVVSGTIAVALMGVLAAKNGTRAAIIAVVLGATSYFLVHYSSEARGYAPAMMFAVASAILLDRHLIQPTGATRLAFGGCVILGLLSHLSFLAVYLGLFAWSLAACKGRGRDLLRLHAPVFIFIAALYLIDIHGMVVGAGPIYPRWKVVLEAASWTVALPRTGFWPFAAALLVAGICAGGIWWLWRESRGEALFYAIAIVAGPALTMLLWRQPYIYPRYFVLCVPFFLVLLARSLARFPLPVAIVVVLFLMIGNAPNLYNFYRLGRGQYLSALHYMVDHDGGAATTVGSLQERRNRLVLAFYQRYFPPGTQLEFVDQADYVTHPPRWFIVDSAEGFEPTLNDRMTAGGARYIFDREFQYSGLSGLNWYVFRRVN